MQVLVVGAGVVGLAVARAAAIGGHEVVVAEAASAIGTGVSSRNSEVIHAGLYYPTGSKRAYHCPRGRRMLYEFCASHGVPHRKCGKLVVATNETETDRLAALAAGAKLVTPARFDAALEDNGRVVGARLQMGGTRHDVQAQWVVLANGASPQALQATGMCTRRTPSGMALRGYVKNDAMAGRIKALEVVWHPKLRPGYGWIFPAPGGSFNGRCRMLLWRRRQRPVPAWTTASMSPSRPYAVWTTRAASVRSSPRTTASRRSRSPPASGRT